MLNWLPATRGSPRTGKSFLLDEIVQFRKEDIDNLCPGDVKPIVSDIVSVLVTYNSLSPYNDFLDSNHTEAGLALRVLWRYIHIMTNLNMIFLVFTVERTGMNSGQQWKGTCHL